MSVKLVVFIQFFCIARVSSAALMNCPMNDVKKLIEKASSLSPNDVNSRVQMIKRIMEDTYGGQWGVLLITDVRLVSTQVHWSIPDIKNQDGTQAFCLHVHDGVQYNVFKTSGVDSANRLTVDDFVKNTKMRVTKKRPEKMSAEEVERANSRSDRPIA